MHIVYGLGNPGRKYRRQRHNVGRMLVDRLADDRSISLNANREGVRFGEGAFDGSDLVLACPTTYMNNSGTGFQQLQTRFNPSLDQMLVVLDDMDLNRGTLRLRPSGSDGGHKGLRSILDAADSRDVPRMRIGIGRPPNGVSPSDYVLGQLTDDEQDVMQETLSDGVAAVKRWMRDGMTAAMNEFNS